MAFVTEKFKDDLKDRCFMYVEVLVVSVLWFGFLFLITAYFINDWKIALAFAPIFLLPYLVIASTVWGVKLGIMGARADAIKGPPAARARTKPKPEKKQ